MFAPAGTFDTVPKNKKTLTNVLTYHVVPGRLSAKDLMVKIEEGHGNAMLKTVEGADLTFAIRTASSGSSTPRATPLRSPSAMSCSRTASLYVIDTVLLPG